MMSAGLMLLAGLWAGLARLGWNLPQPGVGLPGAHGPLMIGGFLGGVIGLERAVALHRPWAYGASLFAVMGGLALLIGLPAHVGHALAAAASLFLVAIFVVLYRKQHAVFLATIGLGAFLWFVGNSLWHAGYPINRVVPWWIGFLVLTIAGERLELSRLIRLSVWSRAGFLSANGVFVLGLAVSLVTFDAGIRICGIGLLAVALWLFRYDIARRTVRQRGLPRFMSVSLLSGYFWLALGGLLWLLFADFFGAGAYYDAMLHAIFLGFIFSMIFGHAPIIFPSVTGFSMPFQESFYAHLVLLHFSLLLRIGGDLFMSMPARSWGGLLNALAILLFIVNNAHAIRLGHLEELKAV